MKPLFILSMLLLLFMAPAYSQSDAAYAKKVEKHRKKAAKEFQKDDHSPFVKGGVTFHPLPYYAPDPTYKVTARLTLTPDAQPFDMPTSTDRLAKYVKYGVAEFELEGKTYQLSIYRNLRLASERKYKDYLFLPFKDYTNGNGSYGGGRYLDLKVPKGDKIEIDFNLCYNPYCAYADIYSCPIPPDENHLKVEIPAGIKAEKH